MNLPRGAQLAIAPNRQQRRQAARKDKKAQRGAGDGGAKPELDRLLGQALAQQKAGRHREALHIFHQILTRQPDHLETLNCAGLAAYHMGDCNLAIRFLQAAINRKPDYVEAHSNLGSALAIAGRTDEAMAAYRRAVEIAPSYANAHYNLGAMYQAAGRFEASAAAYRKAIALRPTQIESYTNLAAVQYEIGDLGAVETTCRQAIKLQPNNPWAHTTLGLALLARGARGEAEAALRQAAKVDPSFGRAHYYLGQILFREHDPQPAALCFAEALRVDPSLGMVHFFLGITYDLQGEAAAADQQFEAMVRHPAFTDHLSDSWSYLKSNRNAETRLFADSFATLQHALDCAQVDGLATEFGVRFGTSLNFLAGHVAQEVHGFDSFQGLPEAWDGVESGLYTTGGRLPQVGQNIRLHVGLFADTIPVFAAEHPGPIRFMNVDCDIYSSTKTIFDQLAERIVPGTIIVFDEYLMNPNWRHDEFKAFQEAVRDHAWTYEYLAFNLFTKQAVVRIL